MTESVEPAALGAPERETEPSDRALSSEEKELSAWQQKLLPFMTYMLLGLTVFFFLASLGQLVYLHRSILQGTKMDSRVLPELMSHQAHETSEQVLAAGRLQALTALELYLLERRYHQANVLLMSGVWVRYLGFVTGMTLALVGATFILGKLREPPSELEVKSVAAGVSFVGASPGILLVVVGVALMLTTILAQQEFAVTDRAVFLDLDGFDASGLGVESSGPDLTRTPTQLWLEDLSAEEETGPSN